MAPYILLALLIFSISLLSQLQKAGAPNSMTKPGCEKQCGDEVIPYPFGVKNGCYFDESFRIFECGENVIDNINVSTHTLRFKKFPVLAFDFNQSSEESNYTTGFGDNRFSISHTRNMFVVLGCDIYGYFTDPDKQEFMGGCGTLCGKTNITSLNSSPCSGLRCCQISLQKDLTSFTFGVTTMNTLSRSWAKDCSYVTIVGKNFFRLNNTRYTGCNDTQVSIIVEWTVGNTSCNIARKKADYACGQSAECIDPRGKGYRCKCKKGYQGNPYLPHGCQDIDECENPVYNHCPANEPCVNTAGGYYCLGNRKHRDAVPVAIGTHPLRFFSSFTSTLTIMLRLIPLKGTSLAVGLLILVATGLWVRRKLIKIKDRKMKKKFFKRNGGLLLQQQISSSGGRVLLELIHFAIEDLQKATDNFSESRVLGKGGLGTVYKGMLSDGRIVAVKKANKINESQVDQFINEVFILSQINHRHIVRLLGCCLETEVPLLVYEYISNGTLSHHLHDEPNSSTFSWDNRLRIAAEVAGALAYLHSSASTAIFHRDIKSNNILLDENYRAVISDFGLSRSVPTDITHLTTFVGGTIGYLDPEYFRSGQFNEKSDVYAFGVILAELLTGQKAISSVKDDQGLALRFRTALEENRLFEILENVVACEGQEEEILVVAKLAKRCLKISSRKRPCMREVAAELEQLRMTKELERHQEKFPDTLCSKKERCNSTFIDSGSEDDSQEDHQTVS